MRKKGDKFTNRISALLSPARPFREALQAGTRDAFVYDKILVENPCVPDPRTGCLVLWQLHPELVAWCRPEERAVLGPTWRIEVVHSTGCPRGAK